MPERTIHVLQEGTCYMYVAHVVHDMYVATVVLPGTLYMYR